MEKRQIVLGIGNLLQRDESLGIQAVRVLSEKWAGQSPVEFLDGSVLGLDLLPLVEDASHLLVLDVIDANQVPGTLIELDKEQIPLFNGIKLSQHQVSFQEVLGLAALRGYTPEYLKILGAQPADLETGLELSGPVAAIFPQVLARAEEILKEWGLLVK
jgi:hydrogenase maturation protease